MKIPQWINIKKIHTYTRNRSVTSLSAEDEKINAKYIRQQINPVICYRKTHNFAGSQKKSIDGKNINAYNLQ